VQVQIATEAPGRSPEEVERFVTVPLEIAMTGLPGLEEMRSLNKPGLSLITLVFTDADQCVLRPPAGDGAPARSGAACRRASRRCSGPVSTGLGEVYQYTLERPDDGDRALTAAGADRAAHRAGLGGAAAAALDPRRGRDQLQGGYVRQYQVLVNPDRCATTACRIKTCTRRWRATTPTPAAACCRSTPSST
jgi:cobalt-zinc-cadmium resistance protein CzcA